MRPQLTVHLASETGPVFGGASGALYGLSEEGVPGTDLLAPLRVRTIAQKPPGGLQHPTGDADKVAPGFFAAGGELILVYLQDMYQDWPYKDGGIADYLTKVRSAVRSLTDGPYRNRVAFVPFNEPDWIWYDLKTTDPALNLTAGSHAITFGVSDPGIGTAQGQVTLNMIKLAYASAATPGVTHPAGHYPAVYADLSGSATVGYGRSFGGSGSPSGYVTAPAGSGVRFVGQADHDGYYDLRLRYAAAEQDPLERFSLLVSGSYLKDSILMCAAGLTFDRVYLHAGINPVEYRPEGAGGAIDSLYVTPDATADAASAVTYAAAAPQNVLSGTAALQLNRYAYGGRCVRGIGDGAASTLTFTGVMAPWAGTYRVILSYASNDRAGSGNYNVNLIDPEFTVTTSAGTRFTTHARNTYSWNQFNTVALTVQLAAGENAIVFGNPLGRAPDIDKIIVAPASLP